MLDDKKLLELWDEICDVCKRVAVEDESFTPPDFVKMSCVLTGLSEYLDKLVERDSGLKKGYIQMIKNRYIELIDKKGL